MNTDSAHIFAFYSTEISTIDKQSFVMQDEELVHRIAHVLRLGEGEQFILFDRTTYAQCMLQKQTHKRALSATVISRHSTMPLTPAITILLPLLKKEALETALYNAVELGANAVQLVITEKSRPSLACPHELKRMENIMIAAAEQSKYFPFPLLAKPLKLQEALEHMHPQSTRFVCTPDGTSLISLMQDTTYQQEHYVIALGPEGDLTTAEYEILRSKNFVPCALTPTILRSPQALAISLGIMRTARRIK